MNVTHKLHDSPTTGRPAWVTIRIKPNTGDEEFYKSLRPEFLLSLIERKAIRSWKDALDLGATFKLRKADEDKSIALLVERTRLHLRILKDQLAGLEDEKREAARILPPARYAEVV